MLLHGPMSPICLCDKRSGKNNKYCFIVLINFPSNKIRIGFNNHASNTF